MKAIIYKIIDNTNDDVYFGSTKNKVEYRITEHKYAYKQFLEKGKTKRCCESLQILCNENWSWLVVEEIEFENKQQLLERERFYIENNKCINKHIPIRKKGEIDKIYYENNKDKCLEYQKEYREKNKEMIKEKGKKYYDLNRQSHLENKKKYHEKNRELINEKQRKKVICECGIECNYNALSRHKKSKKHLLYLDNL
jgi:hypothetical protein